MSNLLQYKNYHGTVEYSSEDDCLFGKVIGLKSLISYEGSSLNELKHHFETSIDEYLQDCDIRGVQPEKQYKGSFNIRISPDLHRDAALYANINNKTLNAVVEEAIQYWVETNAHHSEKNS